jgi:type VI secretion system secreted protein VgrG
MSMTSDAQTLVSTLLAALGPSQNQRLLRLYTPLGPNVLLAERVDGCEAIGPTAMPHAPAGFRFDVLALSTDAHLELKGLIGQPVRLDLLTQQSAVVLRPFHGHVTAFALLGSDGGLARYRLTIEPWLGLLAHRQDAWVFQNRTAPQIVDEVFAGWQGQGRLMPAWRWELLDAAVYAERSLCIQYHESDLAFVQRLLREEGLFCWFEHQADDGPALGSHTLVIADHNGAFQPDHPQRIRFTQSAAASFKEDSLSQFSERRALGPTTLSTASWDHRQVQSTSAHALGYAGLAPPDLQLTLHDQPGAYAYETPAQAERLARRHLEALQSHAHQFVAQGTWRQAACGRYVHVIDHDGVDPTAPLVTLEVRHRARNNLSAAQAGSLTALLGPWPAAFGVSANNSDEPLYQATLTLQDARIAVRAPTQPSARGDLAFERAHVPGTQSAVVVGLGDPAHTDRDGRIKVQFHWQLGDRSAHRLKHAEGSNAPGDASAGCWVRVAQAWAGSNWGERFIPRLGQEVLVAFVEGDIDRPIVIGSLYNGVGQPDAQGNQVADGSAGAWFPGTRANGEHGEHDGHRHAAVLSGFKSQSLDTSAQGSGGHNQLVFDDTPAQARITLGTTQAQTWLNLGHLLQQTDNQRLAKRGHGLDLATTAHGALRAGAGLHLSAHANGNGTQANVQPVEAHAAVDQLKQALGLTQSLAATAQTHAARLPDELEAAKLPVNEKLQAGIDSLQSTDRRAATTDASDESVIGGGDGAVAAWSRPDLLLSAPAGIAMVSPAHAVWTAGHTASWTAGQDINLTSQRHTAVLVRNGISLFSYGKAQNPCKPNTETGIQLHAASGSVSLQAQAGRVGLTAAQAIEVSSSTQAVTMAAPTHILLTAGGSSLRIEPGGITLTTQGGAEFKGAMKELTEGQSVKANLQRTRPADLKGCAQSQVVGLDAITEF